LIERLPYQLCEFFWRHASSDQSLALITVLNTEGSTYSKAGSQMLVNESGDFHGMLSGGCLEGDLAERSRAIIESGVADVVTYDLRADDDVFGLGVGCEGVLRILIQPLSRSAGYEPFASLLSTLENSKSADLSLADLSLADLGELGSTRILAPLRLLILGAGIDAEPLIQFAAALGWKVSVSDHRPASVARLESSPAASVACVPYKDVASHYDLSDFDAAIIMSHNLQADRAYLRALAGYATPFVGLLGPPHRRDRLLSEIGDDAKKLGSRLHAPVGKQIGGRGPAAIALEIAVELQSTFSKADQS
jgi:xanthine dehydrogenase accessory factor